VQAGRHSGEFYGNFIVFVVEADERSIRSSKADDKAPASPGRRIVDITVPVMAKLQVMKITLCYFFTFQLPGFSAILLGMNIDATGMESNPYNQDTACDVLSKNYALCEPSVSQGERADNEAYCEGKLAVTFR
jgi:hypothetical protein